ncbi:MAG: DHH family phosphoesterase [Candidatus Bathyarchaeota archaeon B63]|nr:MAG: DHH family phosphoesterase [Candidatus Bathyarchaeota archaeon B63]
MSFHAVRSLIQERAPKLILILCHQNADPDALCAAYVFSSLLRRIIPNTRIEVASPEGISKLSEALSDLLPIRVLTELPEVPADVIVMLDTNTVKQLGPWERFVKRSTAPLIVIDHHASHPETERMASIIICDENASSTCEIIHRFFDELGIRPSREEAQALFLGIAFDTKHFVLANSETFKAAAALVEAGVDAQKILSRLSLPTSLPERIARLKACRRMQLMRIDDWLIAFSKVSSFQASAARALVGMGAHLAMVGGQKGDSLQISIRSDPEFHRETGFHLGRDLAKPLGEFFHGMGGGHSTAAGVNGTGDYESAVKRAIRIIREKLGKKGPPSD